MISAKQLFSAASCALLLAAGAHAAPITGEPLPGGTPGWSPNSTNALNYTNMVPGREGQNAPYVLFVGNDVGEVTLQFTNFATAGIAFFELRIDGIEVVSNPNHPNPFLTGVDVQYPGQFLNNGDDIISTIAATQTVDVRLALGGERDWDFDWVTFSALSVPTPAPLALLALGLLGFGLTMRRRS